MTAKQARKIGKEEERRNALVKFRKIEKQIKNQCYLGEPEHPTPGKTNPKAKPNPDDEENDEVDEVELDLNNVPVAKAVSVITRSVRKIPRKISRKTIWQFKFK